MLELQNIFLKYGLPQVACNESLKVTGDSAFRPNEVKDAKIKGLNDQLLEFCCDTKIEQVNLSKGEL